MGGVGGVLFVMREGGAWVGRGRFVMFFVVYLAFGVGLVYSGVC